jgi:3-methyladenine DNA glycosylase AlkC
VAEYKLKDFFNASLVGEIGAALEAVHPAFDTKGFVRRGLDGLDRLELLDRGWHLAEALHEHLPQPFPKAADVLVASLGPEHAGSDQFGMAPFRYLPHVFFVQKYGLDHFEPAMRAQYELTKRFSAESSIRAYLIRHPEETYARLVEWAGDDNVHVRRLVSEGSRPRLPWAPRLPDFQKDPHPVIALLEMLKDDPERYVQRSVANNLNDIGKDHPELAIDVCRRWLTDAPAARQWIVKHALRSLVKKGHRGALELMGAGAAPEVAVGAARVDPLAVKVGEKLRFAFELASTGEATQELLVDYAVHFVKANGTAMPKVFKLRKVTLAPAERIELGGTVSLQILTTRRPNPGRHRIDVLVNGVTFPLTEFEVLPAP